MLAQPDRQVETGRGRSKLRFARFKVARLHRADNEPSTVNKAELWHAAVHVHEAMHVELSGKLPPHHAPTRDHHAPKLAVSEH